MRRTYTKTYTLLDAWAQTFPWDCTNTEHDHSPLPNDPCAVEDCGEPLLLNEVCYGVVELPSVEGKVPWVCWRHVIPDTGPLVVRPGSELYQ